MSASWRVKRTLASPTTDLILWGLWICVVTASLVLPIYIGVSFLVMRNCQPHKDLTLPPGLLSDIDISGGKDVGDKKEAPLVEMFVNPYININVDGQKNVTMDVIPRQLLISMSNIIDEMFISRYSPSDITNFCSINNLRSTGPISLAVDLCDNDLKDVVGDETFTGLKKWLGDLDTDVEGDLVDILLEKGPAGFITLLPRVFPTSGINSSHVDSLTALIAPFSPSELTTLISAAQKADLTDKDMLVLEEVSKTSVEDLKNVEKVLAKINVTNLPKIAKNLDLLGIQLSDMITNPAIIFEFFGDDEKEAILGNLQDLLPKFRPSDVETFLQLQLNLEDAQEKFGDPEAPSLMSKLFKIPIDVLVGVAGKLKLDDSAKAGFDGVKLLMEDPSIELLTGIGSQLLEQDNQQKILKGCASQKLDISCRDTQNDMCPMGHLLLGLVSLSPLLIPGLLYSISTFLHYQGDIMQCGLGKPFKLPTSKLDKISAWIFLLPLYMLFMVPWTLFIIVYRQVVVWKKIVKEKKGGPKLEPDCVAINHAASFGVLSGAGHGVPHLGMQLVLLGLLSVGGDILLGIEEETITTTIYISAVSIILSVLVLAVSYLSSQEAGRLCRDLSTPSSSISYIFTSLFWLGTATIVSAISILCLVLLLWVDTEGLATPSWLILPLVFLVLLPVLQCIGYQLLIREGDEQRFCWGLMAALLPIKFLDVEKRRARNYLIISQSLWLLVHIGGWIVYSVLVLVQEDKVVVFQVWLPLVVPLLLLPPLTSVLHWSVSLAPLYSSQHAHPDMADLDKRVNSFPPDWRQISGSNVRPDNLAECGFFYSCRRLKTGEATCYSCGRQVTEWSGKTAAQAHMQASDYCPIYSEDKNVGRDSIDGSNVSCFAEFCFIATTLLFRIGSFCLLIWVFMNHWLQVSSKLPTLYLIPPLYLIILILLNSSIHFSCTSKSSAQTAWALMSFLLPRPIPSYSLSSARRLLSTNIILNSIIHALLWFAMAKTCSPCSTLFSMSSLFIAWPTLLVLGVLSMLSSIFYFFYTVKPSQPSVPNPKPRTTFVVSTSL